MNNSELIVELKDIWVYLDSKVVLKDINLGLERGKFLGIIGPNGAGKTTLLKTILGLIKPDRGVVRLFSCPDLSDKNPHHLIGYVPQNSLIDQNFPLSVSDVVMMGRYGRMGLFHRPSKRDRELVWQSLERVGMQDYADRQIGQLSGGQQQRIFIARALAGEPCLLILDEPTAGVDVAAQDQFYKLLRILKEELSLSVIMVSHDIVVLPSYADELACLNQTICLHGKPQDVVREDILRELYGSQVDMIIHKVKPPHIKMVDR